jgi:hypothetical protein
MNNIHNTPSPIMFILKEINYIINARIPSLAINVQHYDDFISPRIIVEITSNISPKQSFSIDYLKYNNLSNQNQFLYNYLIVKVLHTIDSTYSLDEDTYRKILNLQDINLQHYTRKEKIKTLLKSREIF